MTRPSRYALVAVYCGLTLAAGWTVHEMTKSVWEPAPGVALGIHNEVIAGEAAYPHQFRPLVPWFCELAHRAGVPVRLAYFTQRLACLFLTVLILHVYLRRFVREELCFAGGVILLAVTPFAVIGQGFQPTDPLNLLLFVTAYWLLAERKDGWLYLLVAVGMLNRETIGLVALLAAAVRLDAWRSGAYWRLVGGLALLAVVIYVALHVGYGPRESFTELISPAQNIPENLRRAGSLRVVVLYGALWWFALVDLGSQPAFLRRSTILIPVFVVVHLCVGLLGETRYFLPLAPTVLPLALRRLYGGQEPA